MCDEAILMEFGTLHDRLAGHTPTLEARAHDSIEPGAVVTTRYGVVVHPDEAQRLEDVVTAAGWTVKWASRKEAERCSA